MSDCIDGGIKIAEKKFDRKESISIWNRHQRNRRCKAFGKVQAEVILYDGNEKLCKEEIRKKLPKDSKCEIVLGALSKELLESLDLVVMSPGVPLDIPAVEQIKAAGIPIWGEIELAYQMSEGMVLAITGTNGKTTTTALLGEIMKAYAESVFVVEILEIRIQMQLCL